MLNHMPWCCQINAGLAVITCLLCSGDVRAQPAELAGDVLILPTVIADGRRYHAELQMQDQNGAVQFAPLRVQERQGASALGGSYFNGSKLLIPRIVVDAVPFWAILQLIAGGRLQLADFGVFDLGFPDNPLGDTRDPDWRRLPGEATDIGVGADGSVWVVGSDERSGGYGIYSWTGTTWSRLSGGAVRIDVGPDGIPWIVNDRHQIFHWSANGWRRLPGDARDIGVGANGAVWVAAGGGIFEWNGIDWERTSGSAVRIDVSPDGVPWVIDQSDDVYELVNRRWLRRPGLARDIGIGADGSVWVIGTRDWNGGHDIFRWDGYLWLQVPGSGRQISAGVQGEPWVVSSDGKIYQGQ